MNRRAFGRALGRIAAHPGRMLGALLAATLALTLALSLIALGRAATPLARAIDAGEATVFAVAGASGADLRTLQARLEELPAVVQVQLVPRDTALAELVARTGLEKSLAELRSNPLPDAFAVRMQGPVALQEAAVASMRRLPRVDAVQFDPGWVRRLAAAGRAARAVALLLAAAALALAAVVAWGAARAAAAVDPRERAVYVLLGAPPALLPGAGAWLGALVLGGAAALAIALLHALRWLAAPLAGELTAAFGTDAALALPPATWLGGFALACAAAGALAGWLRAR